MNKFSQEQLLKWQEDTIGLEKGKGRFIVFDHFGSLGNDEITLLTNRISHHSNRFLST